MSKRARPSSTPNRTRSRRPIDKKLINIVKSGVVGTQVFTNLVNGATYPGTITGLRWSLYVSNAAGGGAGYGRWAIVVLPAGSQLSNISIGDGSSMYDPEQMVLAFGTCAKWASGTASSGGYLMEGQTKAMRKLKAGDSLVFIVLGTATNAFDIVGTVQYFYKT